MKKTPKKIPLSQPHPTFCTLLAGNLPESQKPNGGDRLL